MTSSNLYPPEFNESFKTAIRDRDEYTCAVCGKYGIAVHHINYIKDDTHELNCVSLCNSCHMTTNVNRDHWRRVLTKEVVNRPPIQKSLLPVNYNMLAIQRDYRRRVRARNCVTAINTEGDCKFSLVANAVWATYRRRLARKGVPHLSIPQPNDIVIVVSRVEDHDLPSDLVNKLYNWLNNMPDKRTVGRTFGFGGVAALRDP